MPRMKYDELVKALRHCMTKEDGITICEPCPYYGKGIECENVLHTDAAAAIEELQADMKTYGKTAFDEGYAMGLAKGEEIADKRWQAEVKRLEPKRGHWIENTHTIGTTTGVYAIWHDYTCSVCGGTMGRKNDAYCYKCGAEMEVQDGSSR